VLVSDREALLASYAVNAVEIELENGALASPALAGFQAALRNLPWAAETRQEGSILRIMVQDVPRGKRELLPLIASHGLVLERYEWVRPSLEDIFLQLST